MTYALPRVKVVSKAPVPLRQVVHLPKRSLYLTEVRSAPHDVVGPAWHVEQV
jgi:hypothetical protein